MTIVRLHVLDPLLGELIAVRVPVARGNRAVFDGVRLAGDLGEAVAFIDSCANAGWISLDSFADHVRGRSRARRIRFIREALDLADAAARSPWESRLRVSYVTVAGLPRPKVNVPIFDLEERLLSIADLFDEEAGLVTEFDGQDHRRRRQHRDDNDREEGFEDAGLVVARADSLDMTEYEQRLVARLHSGRRRGLQRDRRRDRWTLREPDWWREQHDRATLTDAEKAQLFGD